MRTQLAYVCRRDCPQRSFQVLRGFPEAVLRDFSTGKELLAKKAIRVPKELDVLGLGYLQDLSIAEADGFLLAGHHARTYWAIQLSRAVFLTDGSYRAVAPEEDIASLPASGHMGTLDNVSLWNSRARTDNVAPVSKSPPV